MGYEYKIKIAYNGVAPLVPREWFFLKEDTVAVHSCFQRVTWYFGHLDVYVLSDYSIESVLEVFQKWCADFSGIVEEIDTVY